MSHRNKAEQKEWKARKATSKNVRSTKVHRPGIIYDRKQERQDIEEFLSQTDGAKT